MWLKQQAKNKKKPTAEMLAAIILSSTEGVKIDTLKKMTKSLRDQAAKDYNNSYRRKKQQ